MGDWLSYFLVSPIALKINYPGQYVKYYPG